MPLSIPNSNNSKPLQVEFQLTLQQGRRAQQRVFPLNISFQTQAARTVIFGPSGSGKSLTLQVIAGLLKPNSGRVQLGDQVFFQAATKVKNTKTFIPAAQREVGFLFQDYALFPNLTVFENVGFGVRAWPLPLNSAQKQVVQNMLLRFDIAELAHLYPNQLSGGQRQRVAFARTLLKEPQLILLDEPFAALDMMLKQKVREELLAMQEKINTPMLMVSHDLEDVRAFADTLVLFSGGSEGRVHAVIDCQALRGSMPEEEAWATIKRACYDLFEHAPV